MRRTDWIALTLSLAAVFSAYLVADRVFDRLPHIEDEWAYIWQAQVAAKGQLTIPSPEHEKSILIPFVVDYNGQRFGKYPPAWPVVLAMGVRFNARAWVNPLLSGLGVWLTYLLGKKVFKDTIGLLAAFLTLISPFYLINSGTLLSHPWSYVVSALFALSWLDSFPLSTDRKNAASIPGWIPVTVAGISLGLLALTRPLTALGVALPFFIHGMILFVRGTPPDRLRVISVGGISLSLALLFFVWQYGVTGNALLNPYTLWWEYDRIGFGPGIGTSENGHSLRLAWDNFKVSQNSGWRDLFGWGTISWLFLPFGVWAARKNRAAWLTGSVYWSLAAAYSLYWVGAWVYGPRYYFEGLYSITLISAAGIFWLASQGRFLKWGTILLVTVLTGYNLLVYLPERFGNLSGIFGVQRELLAPFQTEKARDLAPALVIVHPKQEWREYGALTELEDPWLTTPFIFAHTRGKRIDASLAEHYPGRTVIHYYMDGNLVAPEPVDPVRQ